MAAMLPVCCCARLQAGPPEFSVSSTALHALALETPSAKKIGESLVANEWCSASPAEAKAGWNQLPSGIDGAHWVSFVTVGFNEQADGYAFMFAGTDGAMSAASHVPFRKTWMPNNTLVWLWPFDGLLGALKLDCENRQRPADRRPLVLNVVPWKDNAAPDSARGRENPLSEARAVDPKLVFSAVSVIANAAAFEADWAPTSAKADWSATCEVRVEDQSCSFRLTLRGPQAEQVRVQHSVPWESYHDHLVRLFRFAEAESGVSDFTQLARGGVQLLAVGDGRLAAVVNQELAVFDLTSGKKTWTTEPAVKPKAYRPFDQYNAFNVGPREVWLMRYRGELSALDWKTGKPRLAASGGADGPERYAMNQAGEAVAVVGGTIRLFGRGQQISEFTQPEPITAGPALAGDNFVYGDVSGRLVARLRDDGSIRKQCQLAGGLSGAIIATEDCLLVFSNADEALVAVDLKTLQERWRCPLGDVPLQAPMVVGDRLLVATKSNRILLVDRASGGVEREVTWPTWLVALTVIDSGSRPMVVCSDLAGTLTLLSLVDLKTVRQIPLAAELTGPVLLANPIAHRWPAARLAAAEANLVDELEQPSVPTGPALLVADNDGFVYILPLSGTP